MGSSTRLGGNGRGESVASYPFPELEHALVEMICPLARVPRPGHSGLRLPSTLSGGPSSILAVSSRVFWFGAFRSTWVPASGDPRIHQSQRAKGCPGRNE